MLNVYLSNNSSNASVEALLPSTNKIKSATSPSGSTFILSLSDAADIIVGMKVTGAGITGTATVSSVVYATGVVTLAGTIGTLTASNYTFSLSIFVALHTGSPGTTGANEVTGGTYTRQLITFSLPSAGIKTSTNSQLWTGLPSCTISFFGFWTAASSGTYIAGGPLASTIIIPAGIPIAASIGAITAAVNG